MIEQLNMTMNIPNLRDAVEQSGKFQPIKIPVVKAKKSEVSVTDCLNLLFADLYSILKIIKLTSLNITIH